MNQVGQELQATGASLDQSLSGAVETKVEPEPEAPPAPDEIAAAPAQMDLGLEREPAADPPAAPKG